MAMAMIMSTLGRLNRCRSHGVAQFDERCTGMHMSAHLCDTLLPSFPHPLSCFAQRCTVLSEFGTQRG